MRFSSLLIFPSRGALKARALSILPEKSCESTPLIISFRILERILQPRDLQEKTFGIGREQRNFHPAMEVRNVS